PEVLALGVDAQAEAGGVVGRFVGAGGLLALGQFGGGRAAAVDELVFEELHGAPGVVLVGEVFDRCAADESYCGGEGFSGGALGGVADESVEFLPVAEHVDDEEA
ncbi:hypothetical protein BST46_30535, partial [Mycobacterium timonense]